MEPINELDKSLINFKNVDGESSEVAEKDEIHLALLEEELIEEIFSGMAWNG